MSYEQRLGDVDPDLRALLVQMREQQAPEYWQLTLEAAREMLETRARSDAELAAEVASVRDVEIPAGDGRKVDVRIYSPDSDSPRPTLVFFHGGGWVIGSIATGDGLCRRLTNELSAHVVSVEYRLAPESPYPAAIEDAVLVVDHLREQPVPGTDGRIGLAGESSGGSIAAALAIKAATEPGWLTPAFLLLFYPALDHRMETDSYAEFARGFSLTKQTMEWFWRHYLGGREPDELASPAMSTGVALPSAAVFTAEFDPLRDEGEEFASQLVAAGTPVLLKRHRGMLHGFIGLAPRLDGPRRALDDLLNLATKVVG